MEFSLKIGLLSLFFFFSFLFSFFFSFFLFCFVLFFGVVSLLFFSSFFSFFFLLLVFLSYFLLKSSNTPLLFLNLHFYGVLNHRLSCLQAIFNRIGCFVAQNEILIAWAWQICFCLEFVSRRLLENRTDCRGTVHDETPSV